MLPVIGGGGWGELVICWNNSALHWMAWFWKNGPIRRAVIQTKNFISHASKTVSSLDYLTWWSILLKKMSCPLSPKTFPACTSCICLPHTNRYVTWQTYVLLPHVTIYCYVQQTWMRENVSTFMHKYVAGYWNEPNTKNLTHQTNMSVHWSLLLRSTFWSKEVDPARGLT